MIAYKIDMGLYSVVTAANVPKQLEYGRTAANFIKVTDLQNRNHLLNVGMIISISEIQSGDNLDANVVGDIVDNVMSTMFGPKKVIPADTIILDDKEANL